MRDDRLGEHLLTGPDPITSASAFLAEVPDEAARRLLRDAIRLEIPAGGILYREADEPRVFVVLDGTARAYVSAVDGRQVTVRYGHRGDLLGLASVVGGPAPLTIEAMTSLVVVALSVSRIADLIDSDAQVARACARELARQLYRALDDLTQSAFESLRHRLARHLAELAEADEAGHPVVRAGAQGLADAVGSTREAVTRALREMAVEGVVEVGRGRVTLLDAESLAAIAGRPSERAADPAVVDQRASSRSRRTVTGRLA
jgi:CRP/FNR family transcriptional regulator, cyclic AMP receptor protein